MVGKFKNPAKIIYSKSFYKYFLFFLIIGGFLIRMAYLNYTPFDIRTYDVEGHLDYIKYISRNHSLPANNQCWQCYQRPLYYIFASSFLDSMKVLGIQNINLSLQYFSLIIFICFLIVGFMILDKVFNSQKELVIPGAILLCFWPSGIIHSIRIGNDVLFYLFYALALYFIIDWYKNSKKGDFLLSTVFTLLALFTKSNGIILLAIVLIVFLLKILKSGDRFSYLRKNKKAIFILCLSLVPLLADVIRNNFNNGWWIVGNSSSLNSGLFVGNKIDNYVRFDPGEFVRNPFASPWNDSFGRQFFWTQLLKTSLFGEFQFEWRLQFFLAQWISLLYLMMIIYAIVGIFYMKLKKFHSGSFYIVSLSAILSLFAIMVFRYKLSAACSNDFRYIFPIMISAVIFYSLSLNNFRENNVRKISYLGQGILYVFTFLVVAFFIIPIIKYL